MIPLVLSVSPRPEKQCSALLKVVFQQINKQVNEYEVWLVEGDLESETQRHSSGKEIQSIHLLIHSFIRYRN